MLFPMFWQHIYIPVLPFHLLDYCCAPMPYLVGVHLSLLERVRSRALEDVVILNVDTNTLESPLDDLQNLPADVVSCLKSKLKKQSTATGSGVSRAFLRTQAALFGSYRDSLRYKPGEPITFCEESFVAHRSSTMRIFLEMAVNLQLFKQFIDGRLAKLNAGRGFTDVFEEEITLGGFCGSNSRSYQQWMDTVKRGGALLNTAVTKARSHARQGIKGMRSRLKQREEEEGGLTCAGSPTSTKSLSPRRLQKIRRSHLTKYPLRMGCPDFTIDDDELDTASKISSEDSGEVPSYTEDSDDSYSLELDTDSSQAGGMNLLEEILDSLSTSTEQGRLSAAKSLDFFRSMEDIDYTAANKPNPQSESNQLCPSGEGGGGGEQGGWNMGQDDSAVHGKHLPPSPRRQPSQRGGDPPRAPLTPVPASAPTQAVCAPQPPERSSPPLLPALHQNSQGPPPVSTLTQSPSPSSPHRNPHSTSPTCTSGQPLPQVRYRTISDPQAQSEPQPQAQPQPQASSSILRRKVLSKETVKQYQDKAFLRQTSRSGSRQPSVLVPWEREACGGEEEAAPEPDRASGVEGQEKGLLEEIESMCRLSSAFHTSMQLSQVHCNSSSNSCRNNTDKS
ncbi:DENN domain-containing protein 1B-like [Osmerus eperlanus]|uniref:DENN domain-containing protein 1B-like n=1 Tax=Osmerus eperlanus TaxID=29151 RepID=UPI002E0D0E9D